MTVLRHVAVLIGLTLAACSTAAPPEDVASDEGEMVSDDARAVFGDLAFLEDVVEAREIAGPDKAAALGALARALPSEGELARWAGTSPFEDSAVEVVLASGGSATIASRRSRGASAIASVTRVVGPTGRELVYAERLRTEPALVAELFAVDGRALHPVLRKRAEPGEAGALAPRALGFDLEQRLGTRAVLSRSTRASICTACTMGLLGAKYVGPTVLALAGTGGAAATCAKLGLSAGAATAVSGPGAAVVGGGSWLACNVLFWGLGAVISSANLLEGDDARAEACSGFFASVRLGRVCDGIEPEECSVGAIANTPSPKDKCARMGMCARAFNCTFDAKQLCPSLDATNENRALCERIIDRTCQRPLGLHEEADFAATCEAFAAQP